MTRERTVRPRPVRAPGPGRRLLLLASLGSMVLAGCGDDGQRAATGSTHGRADVTFAQQMVPHHRQAVQMSRLAARRADDPRVRALARRIAAAQGPEIATMTDWLRSWGASTDAPMRAMPGMVDDRGLTTLRRARGAAFDRVFLTEMVGHHRGAIAMARTEQADGRAPEAVSLAGRIRTSQSAELVLMRRLLG